MSDPIRVLVVDDHQMFSETLALLLGRHPEIELVGVAGGTEEAIERCRIESPDVVLMDLDLQGMDGIEATRELRELRPLIKVIVVSALQSPVVIAAALAAGACGFVPKTEAADLLVDVVKRAAAGEMVMPTRELPLVLQQLQGVREPRPIGEIALSRLTGRETEILRQLAGGQTTVAIAEMLGISRLTVQSHVKSILVKLGVHSKIEAVTMAWRHGLAPTSQTA